MDCDFILLYTNKLTHMLILKQKSYFLKTQRGFTLIFDLASHLADLGLRRVP